MVECIQQILFSLYSVSHLHDYWVCVFSNLYITSYTNVHLHRNCVWDIGLACWSLAVNPLLRPYNIHDFAIAKSANECTTSYSSGIFYIVEFCYLLDQLQPYGGYTLVSQKGHSIYIFLFSFLSNRFTRPTGCLPAKVESLLMYLISFHISTTSTVSIYSAFTPRGTFFSCLSVDIFQSGMRFFWTQAVYTSFLFSGMIPGRPVTTLKGAPRSSSPAKRLEKSPDRNISWSYKKTGNCSYNNNNLIPHVCRFYDKYCFIQSLILVEHICSSTQCWCSRGILQNFLLSSSIIIQILCSLPYSAWENWLRMSLLLIWINWRIFSNLFEGIVLLIGSKKRLFFQ